MSDNIIEVKDLSIEFPLKKGILHAVNHVDFDIKRGEITALVGESGSGKSTLAYGLLNSVSTPGCIASGSIFYNNSDVLKYNKTELKQYKWEKVSMIFQAAQNALNPVMTVKAQIIETVKAHKPNAKEEDIINKAKELLDYVKLEPKRVLNSYPHELSGGMKQRVMIAFSLILDPELVILDEPTTALDVITQDYIFDILVKIHKEMNLTMLLLTHDIGVVAKVADRVGVMYAGEIVEVGDVVTIFKNSVHPYTTNLIGSAPSLIEGIQFKESIVGTPPDLFNLQQGCTFRSRCNKAMPQCKDIKPKIVNIGNEHIVACNMHCK